MPDLLIASPRFDADADKELLKWLSEKLTAAGYQCSAMTEKKHFWGFNIGGQPTAIWLHVANVNEEGPEYEWGISVDAQVGLNPAAWIKRKEGDASAVRIMSVIKQACTTEGIEIVEEYDGNDDDENRGPLTLMIGPGGGR